MAGECRDVNRRVVRESQVEGAKLRAFIHGASKSCSRPEVQ